MPPKKSATPKTPASRNASSTQQAQSTAKKTSQKKATVKSKALVSDSDHSESNTPNVPSAPELPSTPTPNHGRSLRKRPAATPVTPSQALQKLSLGQESPTKKARTTSTPSPMKRTAKGSSTSASKRPTSPVKTASSSAPTKHKVTRKTAASSGPQTKASARLMDDNDTFVVEDDEDDEDGAEEYQPEEDCSEGDYEEEAVATEDDMEGDGEDEEGVEEVDGEESGEEAEVLSGSEQEDVEDDVDEEDDGEGSVEGSPEEDGEEEDVDGEEEDEEPVYEPGAFYPRPLADNEEYMNLDALKDRNAPDGFYPDESLNIYRLRPGTIESRTSNEAMNLAPSAILKALPQLDPDVFWGVLMFSNWKNVVGLARSPVGLTGCRPYERENIEMTVRGRGTALCVVSGVVQESNLFSPRQWTSTNPNERQEFVSYNILVNPLSFERSRIQAHTVMSMNNFTMKSTEHKGGLNLTTMSAKIGATPVKREPNAFFDLAATMVNTAASGYGTLSPRRFSDKIPIYDATSVKGFRLEDHLDDLSGTLPEWPQGKEIPVMSFVVAGYIVRHAMGANNKKWLLNTYIQWLIVLADKEQVPKELPKATKAKVPVKSKATAKTPKKATKSSKV